MQLVRIFSVTLLLCLTAHAQEAVPTTPAAGPNVATVATQIDRAAQSTNLDLARLRIEKWKTDNSVRQDAQHNSESLQRNLSTVLPGLTAQARSNPNDLVALFRLYRIVGAVYDVLSNVAETAGAFGPKPEYEHLALDVQRFDQARRMLGDAVEQAATRQSADLAAFRNAAAAAQKAAAAAPPTKIIVDDTAPAPKKKRTTKKSSTSTTTQPPQPPQ